MSSRCVPLFYGVSSTLSKMFSLTGDEMTKRYTFYLSDECLLAPMALFYTDLFEITSDNNNDMCKRTRFHIKNPGDPEDPHDQIYLAETSRKYTKVFTKNFEL